MGVSEVVAEGWLVVGGGWHQPGLLCPEVLCPIEGADRVRAAELVRFRRHGDLGIVGEQSDDPIDIAALERVDEAGDDMSFVAGRRQRDVVEIATTSSSRARSCPWLAAGASSACAPSPTATA